MEAVERQDFHIKSCAIVQKVGVPDYVTPEFLEWWAPPGKHCTQGQLWLEVQDFLLYLKQAPAL